MLGISRNVKLGSEQWENRVVDVMKLICFILFRYANTFYILSTLDIFAVIIDAIVG